MTCQRFLVRKVETNKIELSLGEIKIGTNKVDEIKDRPVGYESNTDSFELNTDDVKCK